MASDLREGDIMAKYIDAEKITNAEYPFEGAVKNAKYFNAGVAAVFEKIAQELPANGDFRQRGKWENDGIVRVRHNFKKCSVCGYLTELKIITEDLRVVDPYYCPKCGAKMDEDERAIYKEIKEALEEAIKETEQ